MAQCGLKNLCQTARSISIHKVPRPANPPNQPSPQPIPATPPLQSNQEVPVTSPLQPDQVEIPPDYELMDLDILEDIPDLLDVPEDVMSDFDIWGQECAKLPI